jgi:hypothetical protein
LGSDKRRIKENERFNTRTQSFRRSVTPLIPFDSAAAMHDHYWAGLKVRSCSRSTLAIYVCACVAYTDAAQEAGEASGSWVKWEHTFPTSRDPLFRSFVHWQVSFALSLSCSLASARTRSR